MENPKHLIEVLSLLKSGRRTLLDIYTDENSDIYFYSYQYDHSPIAMSIVATLIEHYWIDQQIEIARISCERNQISHESYGMFLSSLKRLKIFYSSKMDFIEGYSDLIKTKIKGFEELLMANDKMDKRLRSIKFNYLKNKKELEVELEKYKKEL